MSSGATGDLMHVSTFRLTCPGPLVCPWSRCTPRTEQELSSCGLSTRERCRPSSSNTSKRTGGTTWKQCQMPFFGDAGVYSTASATYGPIARTERPLCVASGGPASYVSCDEQWIRDQAFGHHVSGTCTIGANSDHFRSWTPRFGFVVLGASRVVDGSVFPTPSRCFSTYIDFPYQRKAFKEHITWCLRGLCL